MYKASKDSQKASLGVFAAAKRQLRSINPAAPECREAQELLKEVTRRERQFELARGKAAEDGDADEVAALAEDDSDEAATAAPSAPAYSPPSEATPARLKLISAT